MISWFAGFSAGAAVCDEMSPKRDAVAKMAPTTAGAMTFEITKDSLEVADRALRRPRCYQPMPVPGSSCRQAGSRVRRLLPTPTSSTATTSRSTRTTRTARALVHVAVGFWAEAPGSSQRTISAESITGAHPPGSTAAKPG